ncbi:hypothetical protein BD311DRAFT_675597, partial [Dichomitus squalens]
TVLFIYDAVITTGDEVRCFWGRRATGAALLFWLNKYMTMLYLVWDLGTYLHISDQNWECVYSCDRSVKGAFAVGVLLSLILAGKLFTAVRVYALRRSLLLCSMTFLLAMVPAGVNFVHFRFGMTGQNVAPYGCLSIEPTPVDLGKKSAIVLVTIASRTCLIAADCLAIWATWFTLSQAGRVARHAGVLKGSISSVFLVYVKKACIRALAILNSLHLTFTLLSLAIFALRFASGITAFSIPLSAILVSRFLLHLQAASLRSVGSIPSSQALSLSLNSSLVFERVVGSLASGTSLASEDYFARSSNDDDMFQDGAETELAELQRV